MRWSGAERATLAGLGLVLLAGLAVRYRQQQRPALSIAAPAEAASWAPRLAAARQVDVNTADAAELERLPGVGPALARRIVEERTARGPFASPDDLIRVRGIGGKSLEALRAFVNVSGD